MSNIASVNATHESKYHCTVLEKSRGDHLQGSFCIVPIDNGFFRADCLCIAGLVDTSNAAHENPQFQPLIARQGGIPYVSGRADVETIVLDPLAYFDLEIQSQVSSKGNPKSGTIVRQLEAGELERYQSEKRFFFNAGYMPSRPEVLISLIDRDYGTMAGANGSDAGGYGEARHRLYAGKNGSGKTVFLLEGLAARAIAHPRMGLLALDTKGDLVLEEKHIKPGFSFDFHRLLRDGGRTFEVIQVNDIRMTDPKLFVNLLSADWADLLNRKADMVRTVIEIALDEVADQDELHEIDLNRVTLDAMRDAFLRLVAGNIGWSSTRGAARVDLLDEFRRRFALRKCLIDWNRNIVPLYTGQWTPRQIVADVLINGAIRLVNLQGIDRRHQEILMAELLTCIKNQGNTNYHVPGRDTNAEIIIDEAPRWIPQQAKDNPYAPIIIDAINSTRAYGISWTFATQRLTAIDKDVLAQCHTRYYCKGLGVGADLKHVEDDLGRAGLALYQQLNLDNSYFCLVIGEELNFGSGGHYTAFVGWAGDVNAEIKQHNAHIWRTVPSPRVTA